MTSRKDMRVRYKILVVLTFLLLALVAYFRLRVGLVRYFDTDEFPYLNWSYHMAIGYRPYVDFFFLISPLYLLFHIPTMMLFQGMSSAIAARVSAWILTLTLSALLGTFFYLWKKNLLGALLCALILLVLPMPSDKFFEIRPDPLAMVFFLSGLLLLFISFKSKKKIVFFFTGLFFALSLLTLQKVLPFIFLCAFAVILKNFREIGKERFFRSSILLFLFGLSIPLGVFTVWAFSTGSPDVVFYSLIKLPVELAEWYRYSRLPVTFYFWPNNTYYGTDGTTLGNVFNSILWIFGSGIALLRLIQSTISKIPIRPFEHLRLSSPPEFTVLLACLLFLSYGIYYVSLIRFPQYLIPSAIFLSFFIADGLIFSAGRLSGSWISSIFFVSLLILFGKSFFYVHLPKMYPNRLNTSYFTRAEKISSQIPRGEYVLDLDGITLYYPYPYYFCCLPWPLTRYPTHTFPSLKDALIKTHTKYIYEGPTDWVGHFNPDDLDYLKANYEQEPGKEYWVRKKT